MVNRRQSKRRYVKTIAVASGKGGVGKTNIVANLAIAVKKRGKDVMILDADFGLSNIDVLLSLKPKYDIQHLLNGEKRLKDVMVEGPHGVRILPASSGVQRLTALDEFQRLSILEAFDTYEENVDFLFIDTDSGISENVAFFCSAVQETIVVSSAEPASIIDASALMKVLFSQYREKEFNILVNLVRNAEEGLDVFRRLSCSLEPFSDISLKYLGYIPFDEAVRRAVQKQRAFIDVDPDCSASRQVTEITSRVLVPRERIKGTLQFFIGNLLAVSNASPGRWEDLC